MLREEKITIVGTIMIHYMVFASWIRNTSVGKRDGLGGGGKCLWKWVVQRSRTWFGVVYFYFNKDSLGKFGWINFIDTMIFYYVEINTRPESRWTTVISRLVGTPGFLDEEYPQANTNLCGSGRKKDSYFTKTIFRGWRMKGNSCCSGKDNKRNDREETIWKRQ